MLITIAKFPDFLRKGDLYKSLIEQLPDKCNEEEYVKAINEEFFIPDEAIIKSDNIYDIKSFISSYRAYNALNIQPYSREFYLYAFENKDTILKAVEDETIKMDGETIEEIILNRYIFQNKYEFIKLLNDQEKNDMADELGKTLNIMLEPRIICQSDQDVKIVLGIYIDTNLINAWVYNVVGKRVLNKLIDIDINALGQLIEYIKNPSLRHERNHYGNFKDHHDGEDYEIFYHIFDGEINYIFEKRTLIINKSYFHITDFNRDRIINDLTDLKTKIKDSLGKITQFIQ